MQGLGYRRYLRHDMEMNGRLRIGQRNLKKLKVMHPSNMLVGFEAH